MLVFFKAWSKDYFNGSNGAGKKYYFCLISGINIPESGIVNIVNKTSIAFCKTSNFKDDMNLTYEIF